MKLCITADGLIHGLWDDRLELPRLGPVQVRRASHIEFDDRSQTWCVRAARPRGWLAALAWYLLPGRRSEVLFRAESRVAALGWEAEHLGMPNRL
jgi:hypothetical protein